MAVDSEVNTPKLGSRRARPIAPGGLTSRRKEHVVRGVEQRRQFPKVPATGFEKAAGLNHLPLASALMHWIPEAPHSG